MQKARIIVTDAPTLVAAIDAGHTRVKFGVYRVTDDKRLPVAQVTGSVMNDEEFDWKTLSEHFVGSRGPHSLVTGSNRDKIALLTRTWPVEFSPPLVLASKAEIPIRACVAEPERVGADRLLNGVAVNQIRQPRRPAIIIDSGTAMTVDALNSDGEFLGGAILPGILMNARGLNQFTTTLPLIDGREFLSRSPDAIGRNTEAAMASGLYWGHLGAARELFTRINEDLGGDAQCFLTGGASTILKPFWPDAKWARALL